jgi:curved DNA-binding protein CbpA
MHCHVKLNHFYNNIRQCNKYLLFTPSYLLHTTCRSNQKDYYKVLNIEKNSTKQNIKQAYYKLSKVYHPDINNESEAETKFKEIQEAYDILGDESRKNEYDQSINQSHYYENKNNSRNQQQQQNPFNNRHSNIRNRTTSSTSSYDFKDYYNNKTNYKTSSSSGSSGSGINENDLNNYWNNKEFGPHDEIKDAYKRTLYTVTFSFIIVLVLINMINMAINRERQIAIKKADQIRKQEINYNNNNKNK